MDLTDRCDGFLKSYFDHRVACGQQVSEGQWEPCEGDRLYADDGGRTVAPTLVLLAQKGRLVR